MSNDIKRLESNIAFYSKMISRRLHNQREYVTIARNKYMQLKKFKSSDYRYIELKQEIKMLVGIQKRLKNLKRKLYNEARAVV